MPAPKSELAYAAPLGVLERAIAAPRGTCASFQTSGQALNFRQRLYTARKAQRKLNNKMYPPDHELHDASPYDSLTFILKDWAEEPHSARVPHLLHEVWVVHDPDLAAEVSYNLTEL